MNINSKLLYTLKVLRNLKIRDLKELIILFKSLIKGWKIFVVFSPRIGHQLLNTLAFTFYISPEEASKLKLAVSNPKRLSSNIFITNFWNEYLHDKGYLVFSGDLSNLVIEFLKKMNNKRDYVGHKMNGTKEYYLTNKKTINSIYHNRNDCGQIMDRKFKPFPRLKFKPHTPTVSHLKPLNYVCAHTRDSKYLELSSSKDKFSYHNYRDDDYLKLLPSIKFINSKNLSVLRMGNVKKNIDNSFFSKEHIDFKDTSPNGFDDMTLCSNCLFYIGDTSGLAVAAAFFGRPVLRYNWVPIFNSLPYTTLVLPMLIKDIKTDKFLSYKKVWELKLKGLNISNGKSYKEYGLECVRNTSEDIYDASVEMFRRVQDEDFDYHHPKQKEYEEMMESLGWPNPGVIAYSFMEKYNHLFLG